MAKTNAAQMRLLERPPPLEVRGPHDFTARERFLLEQASFPRNIAVEAWTAKGTNRQLAYSTHGVFRYFGKFPPTLAAHLIERFTRRGESVLDPMVGSGTTAVEAALLRRDVVARDVSPLSVLLSRVKTTPLEKKAVDRALDRVHRRYETSGDIGHFHPVGLRNPHHWFLAATTDSLSRLRRAIEDEDPGPAKDLLLVSFAATVRRVSRATTQQGRLFLDVATALEDAWPTFEARAKQAALAVSVFAQPTTSILIEQKSVLDAGVKPGQHKLLIAHPPYFNNYRYSGVNSLELAWLGCDHSKIRKQEIRESFKVGNPEKVAAYIDDMHLAVSNMVREVAHGGHLALMIGDTTLRGTYIPTTSMLLSRMRRLPVTLDMAALRVPQFTEATWVASQRRTGVTVGVTLCDFVLIFRKSSRA